MKRFMRVLVLASACLLSSQAQAAEPVTIATQGGHPVLVWKNVYAFDKGMDLLLADAPQALWLPYVACVPPSGTKVVMHGFQVQKTRITVIGPQDAGCTGVVSTQYLRMPQ